MEYISIVCAVRFNVEFTTMIFVPLKNTSENMQIEVTKC